MKFHVHLTMRYFLAAAVFLAAGMGVRPAYAQTATDWTVVTPPPALGALQETPLMAADASGDLYVAEASRFHSRIQKRDAQGNWSLVAGPGAGLGEVIYPTALVVGGDGSLYVADSSAQEDRTEPVGRIQKRDPQGNWTLLAGYGADLGQVLSPSFLAVDGQGNLFEAESYPGSGRTFTVQKRDAQGNWTAVADYRPEGNGLPGKFAGISGMAADADGFVYVANGTQVQSRHPDGGWAILTGEGSANPEIGVTLGVATAGKEVFVSSSGQSKGCFDCPAVYRRDAQGQWSALLHEGNEVRSAGQLTASPTGDLFLVDSSRIRRRSPDGTWQDIAGWEDRPGYFSEWTKPKLAADALGNLYDLEFNCSVAGCADGVYRVQKRDPQGNTTFISIPSSFPFGTAYGYSIAADPTGTLYIAGWSSYGDPGLSGSVVYRRDLQGNWSRIAEEGTAVGQVHGPNDLATDSAGNLYVLEAQRVQKRTPGGIWSEFPLPVPGLSGFSAEHLAVDDAGTFYFSGFVFLPSDGNVAAVLKRTPDGAVTPLSMRGGGQTGPLVHPGDLEVDANGNLYVLDTPLPIIDGVDAASRLYRYDAQGSWVVLAEEGPEPGQVYQPTGGLAFSLGALYVGDTGNRRIQRLDLSRRVGDVDQNGIVDVRDVILSLQYSVSLAAPQSDAQRQAADVNRDASLTVADSVWILRSIVGAG